MPITATIEELRLRIARLERRGLGRKTASLRFGIPAIDQHIPGIGLAPGALHEFAGAGAEAEHAAAATLLLAGLLARRRGPVLWVLERRDLFAPALAGAGLNPDRVVFAEAGRAVLLVMEEGLRHAGLAGVVGEVVGRLGLTASRRLQLAAEASGVPGFALRRTHGEALADEPNAAATRWRVAALPSPPPLPHAPGVPGLSRALWTLDLVRCRGGAPATWTVEACDAKGHLALATDIRDRQVAPLHRTG
jgi:protein ImuA